jgi:hypothetical protein
MVRVLLPSSLPAAVTSRFGAKIAGSRKPCTRARKRPALWSVSRGWPLASSGRSTISIQVSSRRFSIEAMAPPQRTAAARCFSGFFNACVNATFSAGASRIGRGISLAQPASIRARSRAMAFMRLPYTPAHALDSLAGFAAQGGLPIGIKKRAADEHR